VARLIWTSQAKADLREIRRFIFKESPQRARLVTTRITEATRQVELFPLPGRVVPQSRHGDYREILVSPYRILYRLDRDTVEIAMVIHGARRLPELPDT
jgi:toxin ParE1/3/4